jgi:hypothetical protein
MCSRYLDNCYFKNIIVSVSIVVFFTFLQNQYTDKNNVIHIAGFIYGLPVIYFILLNSICSNMKNPDAIKYISNVLLGSFITLLSILFSLFAIKKKWNLLKTSLIGNIIVLLILFLYFKFKMYNLF